ncbi:nuclear RNA export factor 2-like [Sciurus carolinensis]|uniref:nuclear RNA export factor 2-like n=1 Tax=Sciurus carolinensis TaxID=30640 RepID=UPI001FB24FB8|nr:nuclear RNA export factor 2-like [Sciurus carolinensis]XP_047392510.1 nuclear RNA export factor 2-like [Sciurus carolinensis]
MEMRDVHDDPQVRYTPYAAYRNNRREKWHNEEHIHVNQWRDRKPQGREMGRESRDGEKRNWFKVTIPYGRKYDKAWLMNSIQSHCSVSFTPVDFHYIRNRARFFVQDASTASALKDVSYKICDEDDQKVLVFVGPSAVPYSVQNTFSPEQVEQLKVTIRKRYDVSQQALDLQKLRFDPDLVGHDIDMILNRRNCMFATLQIIERDFPELLSLNLRNNKLYRLDGLSDIIEKAPKVKILNLSNNELRTSTELDKLKGLKLEELWLEGNPLCSAFPDQSAYVSAIQDCFPKLLRLDGQDLPTAIVVDLDVPKLKKPCMEDYKGSETLRNVVLQFLQEYHLIYDYGDREGLLSAYHDKACFSLTIPFHSKNPAQSSFCKFFKDSKNMRKLEDSYQWKQLKHTKFDILGALCVMPKTRHDLSSFVVDMWFQTETMLCFSVNGVFKEVEGKSQGCVHAFTRTFIVTPGRNSSLCIVNDHLLVRDATPAEIQSAFSNPIPALCSTFMSTLSQEQRETVQAFSIQSGMKLEWSKKCLEDNQWNYIRAGQVFTMLQTQGKIPEEAFKRMP